MDDEPDFRFSCSQAQQYEWVRQREPELFERIAAKVAAGQWVPVGGMWVEADMNLPSGESIVRQIVHGQRWFEEHLGVTCTEVWIPDVFGYPAGLPQVFAAGGMRRFVTQKLSWNRTNRFPHQTFWWEGIDGTRVLTHFPPVDTYSAEITPAELAESIERFAEHAWSNVSLIPYGYGDGGGGPTREMLARADRLADLDRHAPGRARLAGAVLRARRGRGGGGRARAGVARRAVLRDPSGDADEPAAHEARQPAVRAAAARGRAVGGDGSRRRRRRRSPRARRAVARGAHPAVPRHPPGLVDRLGPRRRRGGASTGSPPSSSERIADASRAARRPPARVANAATFDRAEVVVDVAPPSRRRPHASAAPTGARRPSSRARASDSAPLAAVRRRRSAGGPRGRGHRPLDVQRPARRRLGARRRR